MTGKRQACRGLFCKEIQRQLFLFSAKRHFLAILNLHTFLITKRTNWRARCIENSRGSSEMCSNVGAEHFPEIKKLANICSKKTLAAPVPPLNVSQLCKPHSLEPFQQAILRGIIRPDIFPRTKVMGGCILVWMVVFPPKNDKVHTFQTLLG